MQPFSQIIEQSSKNFVYFSCRLVRTSQGFAAESEEFLDPCQGNGSPFTTLVGDCERPSLAPMTPHSRHHVSQLKESLRKQLEQLYDK